MFEPTSSLLVAPGYGSLPVVIGVTPMVPPMPGITVPGTCAPGGTMVFVTVVLTVSLASSVTGDEISDSLISFFTCACRTAVL